MTIFIKIKQSLPLHKRQQYETSQLDFKLFTTLNLKINKQKSL